MFIIYRHASIFLHPDDSLIQMFPSVNYTPNDGQCFILGGKKNKTFRIGEPFKAELFELLKLYTVFLFNKYKKKTNSDF